MDKQFNNSQLFKSFALSCFLGMGSSSAIILSNNAAHADDWGCQVL
jgi:hypothetical protein